MLRVDAVLGADDRLRDVWPERLLGPRLARAQHVEAYAHDARSSQAGRRGRTADRYRRASARRRRGRRLVLFFVGATITHIRARDYSSIPFPGALLLVAIASLVLRVASA